MARGRRRAAWAASQAGEVWRRDFENGLVLVNSSSAATVTVPLGASYIRPTGSIVTSVVLPPHTGLVLHRP